MYCDFFPFVLEIIYLNYTTQTENIEYKRKIYNTNENFYYAIKKLYNTKEKYTIQIICFTIHLKNYEIQIENIKYCKIWHATIHVIHITDN